MWLRTRMRMRLERLSRLWWLWRLWRLLRLLLVLGILPHLLDRCTFPTTLTNMGHDGRVLLDPAILCGARATTHRRNSKNTAIRW
jgi:hypothetical protein